MELNSDIKLQLINGVPIFVNGIGYVYPLTIKEIAMCIESKYNSVIGLFTRELHDLDIDDIEECEFTYFDFLIFTCAKDDLIKNTVEDVLSKILRSPVTLEREKMCFFIGDKSKDVEADKVKLIDNETIKDFADVLRFQNCIEKTQPKKKKKKVTNSKVEMLKQKRNSGRKLLREAKGEDFCMAEIQSTLGVLYNDLNKVGNMTIYQLNDQYSKIMRKEKYDKEYSSYLAGADPKKLELNTHWSAKQKAKDMDNVAPPN